MANASLIFGLGEAMGQVSHGALLLENMSSLALNDKYSDIVLIVEDQRFYVHKAILAGRSKYFDALLFGGMSETGQAEVVLHCTPLRGWKILLTYIYSGTMVLTSLGEEVILEILAMTNLYGFVELEASISIFLMRVLCVRNACLIYAGTRLYPKSVLLEKCSAFIDANAVEILAFAGFVDVPMIVLEEILIKDSFFAPEVDIFKAIARRIAATPNITDKEKDDLLALVRFPLMTVTEFLNAVVPTKLLHSDVILKLIQMRRASRPSLSHRGVLVPDKNVANVAHGAHVCEGDNPQALLDLDSPSYTTHDIGGTEGIMIRLRKPYIINHIEMTLLTQDYWEGYFNYHISVSMDAKYWYRVVDYTAHACCDNQDLYFNSRAVRFIHLVGTFTTDPSNSDFSVVSFKASHSSSPMTHVSGVVVPTQNVATKSEAYVITYVGQNVGHMLGPRTKGSQLPLEKYAWCRIPQGHITVQLSQPYMVDSLKMFLYNGDGYRYKYYVEVSTDYSDWTRVADRTAGWHDSWQVIRFERQPVVFIRIKGTDNGGMAAHKFKEIYCAHLECPAPPDAVTT